MKFILTKELGRLARWLRILGFDTAYFTQEKESSLIIKALQEDMVILTRNARLGRHAGIKMLHIKSDYVKEQLQQVAKELSLKPDKSLMFSRCILCNKILARTEKGKVKDEVPEYVFKTQNDFAACPQCRRIYWQGSHWGNATKMLDAITKQ